MKGDLSPEMAAGEPLSRITRKLQEHKEHLSTCRTSKLWLQYLNMVDILRKSVKAQRTGNFDLHLESVKDMLPYFVASGHNSYYTKSDRLYLSANVETARNTSRYIFAL